LVEILCQRMQDALQRSVSTPLLEIAVAGLIRRIAIREIRPLSAGAQDPQHTMKQLSQVLARPAPTVLAPAVHRQQRRDELPLGVRDVHSDIPSRGASDFREFAETGCATVASTQIAVADF
jgi:hypothetical protein